MITGNYAGTGFARRFSSRKRSPHGLAKIIASQSSREYLVPPCGPFCAKTFETTNRTPMATASAQLIARNLFRFAREFRREQPEKSSFLSLRIDVDQRHPGFGQLDRSTG